MKFGLFYEWPNPNLRNWKTLFEEGVEQIQYSEEMGFEYCLIAEHHFSNYGNFPAPLMQALYIGQRTRKLQIATGIIVVPIWDVLRLAEEVAVLDNLIDGRFICGVGRGYQPHEMSRFGVTLEDSRQKFNESMEVLVKAWTQDESFTYDGEFVNISNATTVWPKPMQKPHPPFWIAGTSVESMKMAAQWDMMPLTTGLLGGAGVRTHYASLIHARKELGKSYHGLELGLQSITHVAETDAEAASNCPTPAAEPCRPRPEPPGSGGRTGAGGAIRRRTGRRRVHGAPLLRQSRHGNRQVFPGRGTGRNQREQLDDVRRPGAREDNALDPADGRGSDTSP